MNQSKALPFFRELITKFEGTNYGISQEAGEYELNISKYSRTILGVLTPQNRSQVIETVAIANRHLISLYPLSKGGNWAFGSRLPVENDSIVLDLGRLDAITEYDSTLGTVRIEPGVSQGELGQYLISQKSDFFIDVTGSGFHTSILGNALERGIAYNSIRTDFILDLEVLLGNGKVLRTGYGAFNLVSPRQIYRYGLGPSLDQLFFQSNFGIVLSATYQLHPIPENRISLQVSFRKTNLAKVMDDFRKLRQEGVIDCIVHAADPVRSATTVCPLLSEKTAKRFWDDTIEKGEWSSILSVYGPRELVKAKLRTINRVLGSSAKVAKYDEKRVSLLRKILKVFGQTDKVEFIDATKGLRGLVSGVATSDALNMAYFSNDQFKSGTHVKRPTGSLDKVEVDQSNLGVLFCVPLAGFTGKNAESMYQIVEEIRSTSGILIGVTLNAMSEKLLEAVISLHFNEQDKLKAHKTLRQLYSELMNKGFYPYRLNPDLMDMMDQRDSTAIEIQRLLKDVFDPNGIISKGRYE